MAMRAKLEDRWQSRFRVVLERRLPRERRGAGRAVPGLHYTAHGYGPGRGAAEDFSSLGGAGSGAVVRAGKREWTELVEGVLRRDRTTFQLPLPLVHALELDRRRVGPTDPSFVEKQPGAWRCWL